MGRMERAIAGSRANIKGRARSTSTRGVRLMRHPRFPYLLHQPPHPPIFVHATTAAVGSGSLSLPDSTQQSRSPFRTTTRYTSSPLLTTITAISCQPLQESTRLDPPLSLQRPQRPQHCIPLSTLQSTHQTHIPIQSKQHLQPSSHVPTPRAPRTEEGVTTCH